MKTELHFDSAVLSSRSRERFIGKISLIIKDINGPKGGLDKECLLMAMLSGKRSIVVKGRGESLRESFNEAILRLKFSLSREKDKLIARRRRIGNVTYHTQIRGMKNDEN
jgi:fatty acid/phospholipid biosynthesis enzyme